MHQARVATRRLRSDLRTFRSLLASDFASSLRDELGWLGAVLGEVRDGDVLLARLRARSAELAADEQAGAVRVLSALENERAAAHTRLVETLASERYLTLLDTLVGAANAPVLRQDAAAAPAADVVPEPPSPPMAQARKRVRRLGDDPTDEELHEIRIRTKRLRYAADAVVPVVRKPARGLARAAAGLQGALGDLNDAVVAAAWLDHWRKRADDPVGERAASALAGLEREDAARQRANWRVAWEKVAAPELRAWM